MAMGGFKEHFTSLFALLICCLVSRLDVAAEGDTLNPLENRDAAVASAADWQPNDSAEPWQGVVPLRGSVGPAAALSDSLLRQRRKFLIAREKRQRKHAPPRIQPAVRGVAQPAFKLKVFTSKREKTEYEQATRTGREWNDYITEKDMRLTWQKLKSKSGSVGKIPGSPSPSEFQWETFQQKCSPDAEPLSARSLPISLDDSVDPQQIFVTKAIADDIYSKLPRYADYLTSIKKRLALSTESLFPSAQKYETCAVVGNHGNLNFTSFGEQIDKHDVVVRLNRGQTTGFKKKVGSKTTFRVTNNSESRVYARRGHRGLHKETLPTRDNVTMVVSRVPPELVGPYLDHMYKWMKYDAGLMGVQFSMLSKRCLDRTRDLLHHFRRCLAIQQNEDPDSWMKFNSASSGLTVLMGFLHLCDHVTVYGVGEDPLTEDTPYQYFANWQSVRKSAPKKPNHGAANMEVHNFALERKWVEAMASANLLRKCEATRCYGKEEPESVSVTRNPFYVRPST